jgi:predicted nucleic acid-binding protein
MAKISTLLKHLQGARVYFDVNPIIYFIEQNGDFFEPVAPIFEMLGEGTLMAFTSELSLTEILIKPTRQKQHKVIDTYKDLLLDPQLFTLTKVGRETFLQAAQLGGSLGMRTPDAIHLASAMENQCKYFITNDKKIRSHGGVRVALISDYM